jgi:hypothetical protein
MNHGLTLTRGLAAEQPNNAIEPAMGEPTSSRPFAENIYQGVHEALAQHRHHDSRARNSSAC